MEWESARSVKVIAIQPFLREIFHFLTFFCITYFIIFLFIFFFTVKYILLTES